MKIIPFIAALSTLAAAATANPNTILRYVFFSPAGALGATENPDVDGVAMVRYSATSGFTSVRVLIRGLQGQSTYGVLVGESFVEVNAIQTNPAGNGNYFTEFPSQVFPAEPEIQIFKYDGDPNSIFDVTNDELRAIATPL